MWMRKRFSWTVPALVTVGALAGAGDAGAATRPARPAAEAIVQFDAGVAPAAGHAAVRPSSSEPGAGGVDPSSSGPGGGFDPGTLATAFVQSTRADKAWADSNSPATGAGATVAVIDTVVAGDLPDFV